MPFNGKRFRHNEQEIKVAEAILQEGNKEAKHF